MNPDTLQVITDTLDSGMKILWAGCIVFFVVVLLIARWGEKKDLGKRIEKRYFTEEDIEDV